MYSFQKSLFKNTNFKLEEFKNKFVQLWKSSTTVFKHFATRIERVKGGLTAQRTSSWDQGRWELGTRECVRVNGNHRQRFPRVRGLACVWNTKIHYIFFKGRQIFKDSGRKIKQGICFMMCHGLKLLLKCNLITTKNQTQAIPLHQLSARPHLLNKQTNKNLTRIFTIYFGSSW